MDESITTADRAAYAALGEIEVTVAVRLGAVRMPLHAAAELSEGSLVTLDCTPESPVALLVNGIAIAQGELVVTEDGELAVEISDVKP